MVPDNKVTVKGLTEGKPYEFRVAAVNDAGPGEYAETKEPIKPAPAPSLFRFFPKFLHTSQNMSFHNVLFLKAATEQVFC